MTRQIVYAAGLCALLAAIAMTIASIVIPEWTTWDVEPTTGVAKPVHYTYGLHAQCSSIDMACRPFPREQECQGPDRRFCSLWRTTGFLMSFAVVAELATMIAYFVVLLGGKQKRQKGWRILVVLLALTSCVQIAAMGIVDHLFENDPRFLGWNLARGFYLCVASFVVLLTVAVGSTTASCLLAEEGGYELISDRQA